METNLDQGNQGSGGEASEIAALRAEVAALRARMEAYERILQIRDAALPSAPAPDGEAGPTAPVPAAHDITADQLLPHHDGFYRLEWGAEGAFRWTGPGPEVHFDTWVDRSEPLIATFRIFHFGTPANAKDLAIEVDGVTYPLTRQGSEKVLVSAPIAPRAADGATRITLKVAHLHSPSARGQADKRMLGVAFQRLRLERA